MTQMAGVGSVPFAWRAAPQPDIVRAAQKDDLYLQQSIDACHDAVMRMFGAIPALQHSKSCKMLATFMYYALTTGAGLQTLGEEYCDIMQLTAQRVRLPPSIQSTLQSAAQQQQQSQWQQHPQQPHDPSAPQLRQPATQLAYGLAPSHTRALLVLLQSLGPPLLDRLVASLDRASEAGNLPPELNSYGSSWAGGDDYSSFYDSQRPTGDAAFADLGGDADSRACTAAAGGEVSNNSSSSTTPLTMQLRRSWAQAAQWLAPRWPAIKTWVLLLGRVHLAAFYLHGTYYEWTKRLLGVSYSSITASKEQRASYKVLGLMLVVQLAISAAMQAKPHLSALRHSMSSHQLQQQAGQHQHAVVLPEGGEQPSGSSSSYSQGLPQHLEQQQQAGASSGSSRGGRQCPLCLSVRTHPTCTPCGHVFCWECIAQWCTEKPECPLCRTAVVSSQLVCVYHSEF